MNSYTLRFARRAALGLLASLFILPATRAAESFVRQITATVVSSTEVQLTWTAGERDFIYRINRTGPGGITVPIGRTDAKGYADRALEPDTTYTYTVISTKSAGYADDAVTATVHTAAWQSQDIGAVGAAGSVQRTGDVYTITGAGADIWGTADAFQFVNQPWTGDGVLIARVDSVANTAPWAKAGIMFRESLAPGSRHVMACVNPNGDSALVSRATTDGASDFGISVYTYSPQWLKLVRQGSTFQAFQSRDGNEWIAIGTVTVDLPATVYAGLAVSSHSEGTPCAAVFDGFNLSSTWDGSGGAVTNLTASASSDLVQIHWSEPNPPNIYGYVAEVSANVKFRTTLATMPIDRTAASLQVQPNTTYYVRVRPTFRDGLGLSSGIVSVTTPARAPGITPATPGALTANVISAAQVNLMWADNSDNETTFIIERSTDGQSFESIGSTRANSTSYVVMNLAANTRYYFRVAAARYAQDTGYLTILSGYSPVVDVTTLLSPTGSPLVTRQPGQVVAAQGEMTFISAVGDGSPTYQWSRNGIEIPGGTTLNYIVNSLQPQDAGVYTAAITNGGGTVLTEPGVIAVSINSKVAGAAHEVGTDIHHPNGNVYDQVLLDGAAAAITADPGQITRISYVDLNDDIVQVEFSGAGTLALSLDNASGPAPAAKYDQPGVTYMKGHASIVIAQADETTNLAIFSVGSANAVNQALFREGTSYDGVADVAAVTILSPSGRFGGVFAGDTHFYATHGVTGVFAPNIEFSGPVTLNELSAYDTASPMLRLGQVPTVSIAGGNLAQPNNRPVQVDMIRQVRFIEGTKSNGEPMPAQTNQAVLVRNGAIVTGDLTTTSSQ